MGIAPEFQVMETLLHSPNQGRGQDGYPDFPDDRPALLTMLQKLAQSQGRRGDSCGWSLALPKLSQLVPSSSILRI